MKFRLIFQTVVLVLLLVGCDQNNTTDINLEGLWCANYKDSVYVEFMIAHDSLHVYACDTTGFMLGNQLYSYEFCRDSLIISTMSLKGVEFNRRMYTGKIEILDCNTFQSYEGLGFGNTKMVFHRFSDVTNFDDYIYYSTHCMIPSIRRELFLKDYGHGDVMKFFNGMDSLVEFFWDINETKIDTTIEIIEPVGY
ncbi:hypothetical protein ACE1ET_09720 [Saccharicrinis sp. FJH62]|uniref:hypothetical protein n=1 Tax=Saccharicrinis sp. FJH62 TaxID=3344657 RepID=UPI0035D41A39